MIDLANGKDPNLSNIEENDVKKSVHVAYLNTRQKKEEMRKKSLILYWRVRRVHRLTNHKQERNMIHLYKSAGKDSANVRKAIKEVIKKCDVCQRTRRSQGHPKFTFPKSSSFNEIIAIDLKEINGVHILWMICSFTRYAKGVVLKSKEASEVVKGLYFGWFLTFGGPS